jgi:hypothetical protein
MKIEDRLAHHRRIAEGYEEAYKLRAQRGGRVIFPKEWVFAEDAVYVSVYFSGGVESPLGKFLKKSGESIGDGATREARVYAAKFPDWTTTNFMCWPAENGATWRSRMTGTTKDGVKMAWHMVDFINTNAQGEITRWETFCDGEEFGPVMEHAVGVRGPFKDFTQYWKALNRRLEQLGIHA